MVHTMPGALTRPEQKEMNDVMGARGSTFNVFVQVVFHSNNCLLVAQFCSHSVEQNSTHTCILWAGTDPEQLFKAMGAEALTPQKMCYRKPISKINRQDTNHKARACRERCLKYFAPKSGLSTREIRRYKNNK